MHAPQVSADAELRVQDGRAGLAPLGQEVQREHARAGGQEAPPEQGEREEAGPLLDGQQQAPDGRCKGRGHACHPRLDSAAPQICAFVDDTCAREVSLCLLSHDPFSISPGGSCLPLYEQGQLLGTGGGTGQPAGGSPAAVPMDTRSLWSASLRK